MSRAKMVFICMIMFLIISSISYAEDDIDDILLSGLADRRKTEQGLRELLNEAYWKIRRPK